jgi:hypothetical protein
MQKDAPACALYAKLPVDASIFLRQYLLRLLNRRKKALQDMGELKEIQQAISISSPQLAAINRSTKRDNPDEKTR